MHYIVRQLHGRLAELGILQLLPSGVQHDLAEAYRRTSFAMSRKSSTGLDLSVGKEFGWDSAAKAIVKPPFELKRTKSLTSEASYLGYDEKSAEHDIIRLSREITKGYEVRGSLIARVNRTLRRQTASRVKLKLLFVFDELDKIELDDSRNEQTHTADSDPKSSLDSILRTLKTLFTTSGITFIFVAGKDVHDRWLDDVGRGDSVYESVFSYDKYLPCIWNDVATLCAPLTDIEPFSRPECDRCEEQRQGDRHFCSACGRYVRSLRTAKETHDAFIKYLSFRGRGIPRRIFRAMNKAVRWSGYRPILAFTAEERRLHETYAELWDLLRLCGGKILPRLFDESTDSKVDSRRLATFYSIDWMLRRGRDAFTLAEVLTWAASLDPKIMPRELTTDQFFWEIIRLLIKGDFLEAVRSPDGQAQKIIAGPEEVRIEALSDDVAKQYRVASRRLAALGVNDDALDDESAVLNATSQKDRCGDYQLESMIGAGGMGRVYRATQVFTGKAAAVKVLRLGDRIDEEIRLRFTREISVMKALRHPNIAKFYDSGEDQGRLFIAMEYIDGLELKTIIDQRGALDAAVAATIAADVADGLRRLHEHHFIRNDVKPGNIMVSASGRVCLIDFGTSRSLREDAAQATFPSVVVGTIAYMAPEQFRGAFDQRADIFSFGVVLYEMLTGKRPFTVADAAGQMHAILHEFPVVPSSLASVPTSIETVAMRCLEKNPDERFRDMSEVREALLACDLGRSNLAEFMRDVIGESRIRYERESATTLHPSKEMDTVWIYPDDSRSDEQSQQFVLEPGIESLQFPVGESTMIFRAIQVRTSIRIIHGPGFIAGTVLDFEAPRIRIGRHGDNDLILDSASVSRFHAEVIVNMQGHWIKDLGSGAGTSVNGTRVVGQHRLPDHSRIEIGDFALDFTAESSAGVQAGL